MVFCSYKVYPCGFCKQGKVGMDKLTTKNIYFKIEKIVLKFNIEINISKNVINMLLGQHNTLSVQPF